MGQIKIKDYLNDIFFDLRILSIIDPLKNSKATVGKISFGTSRMKRFKHGLNLGVLKFPF